MESIGKIWAALNCNAAEILEFVPSEFCNRKEKVFNGI